MSRISINPAEARDAGLAAIAVADEVAQVGAAVASFEVPAMPAELSAKYGGALEAAGGRARQIAAELGRMGEEMQVRAAAAELADGGSAVGGGLAARRLAIALGGTTVVGMGGTTIAVTAQIGRRGLTVGTSSGTTLVLSPRDYESRPRAMLKPGGEESGPVGGRGPAEESTPPPANPTTKEPIGGSAGTHVEEATAAVAPAPSAIGDAASDGGPAGLGHGSELRATEVGQHLGGAIPVGDPPPPESVDRQKWACWVAGSAAQAGLPPTLPLMESLATSGLRNAAASGGTVGLFGIDPSTAYAPAGHGMPRNAHPDAGWWQAHPSAQLDGALRRLTTAGGGAREAGLDDPDGLARWIADSGGTLSPDEYAAAHESAAALVDSCGHSVASGGGALQTAASQLGVSEVGTNSGPEVDRYLAAAGAGSGNPWCAGFVTWVLEQNGHEMPGEGWAAVSNWVHAASSGEHGLSIVDAAAARPGDIVAFDWGGGGDYGSDGHIGFLSSTVDDGGFSTIEGNSGDAVSAQQRALGQGSPVFIRVGGG